MSPALLILKIYTTFKDVQMKLKQFLDISTGFRFLEISVECPVNICSLSLSQSSLNLYAFIKNCTVKISVSTSYWFFKKLVCSEINTTPAGPINSVHSTAQYLPRLDVIVMVCFSFVCLFRSILYNCKPYNEMCEWNQKCFSSSFSTWLTHTFES